MLFRSVRPWVFKWVELEYDIADIRDQDTPETMVRCFQVVQIKEIAQRIVWDVFQSGSPIKGDGRDIVLGDALNISGGFRDEKDELTTVTGPFQRNEERTNVTVMIPGSQAENELALRHGLAAGWLLSSAPSARTGS